MRSHPLFACSRPFPSRGASSPLLPLPPPIDRPVYQTNRRGAAPSSPSPMERAVLSSSCNMSSIIAGVPALPLLSRSPSEVPQRGSVQLKKSSMVVPCMRAQQFPQRLTISRNRQRAMICVAALNVRCAAEQTQTVTRQSSTITIAPIQGKEKSPELDDGGTGFPPRDDDGDGGGGGGGGGPNWSGGFFFFGLLAFLGFLKDKEGEGDYRNQKRRYYN